MTMTRRTTLPTDGSIEVQTQPAGDTGLPSGGDDADVGDEPYVGELPCLCWGDYGTTGGIVPCCLYCGGSRVAS